ncbi:MAG: amidohydrolase [Steroidobacteraceae bacterium]
MRKTGRILTAALAALLPAAAATAVDLLVHSGRIYTGVAAQPWAEAVAIEDGRVVRVGSNDELLAAASPTAQRVDLGGRMAMPGIVDAHSHPMGGAIKNLFECNFPFSAGPEEVAAAVAACAAKAKPGEWIIGGQWDSNFFVNHKLVSPRQLLDGASPDNPVALADDSGHNAWVNTAALAILGLGPESPDPEGGRINREADGRTPNGVLEETAAQLASRFMDRRPPAQLAAAVEEMQRLLNGFGITAVKIANTPDDHLEAITAMDRGPGLTLHVTTSLATPYGSREAPLDIAAYEARRDSFQSKNVNTNAIKIFLDGVPTASRTAGMLEAYAPDDHFPPGYLGEMHLAEELLTEDVKALDRAGFQIKIHTAGDGSVRRALNAIEAARLANGPNGPRHELAHAGYVGDADMARFAELNVAPDFSPYIWSPSPIIQSVIDAVGPRGERYWPTRDLLTGSAVVVAGSDWPSAVDSPNPWPGIESLVTRRAANGDPEGTLWAEQGVELAEALAIFTANSATTHGFADVTGRIEPGVSADLIVLSQDIFAVDPDRIGDTEVLLTLFNGRVVHAREPFRTESKSDKAADLVLQNGKVLARMSDTPGWAEAIAVKDGSIVAVGRNDEVAEWVGSTTQVEDLQGRFVMPGFVDQHVHTYFAGEEMLYGCRLQDTMTFEQVLAKVGECAEVAAEGEWVRGGPWGSHLLPQLYKESALTALDQASKGHPLILRDDTAHNVIVNSAALALIGYGAETPNPEKGEIVRDPDTGGITGLLFESAAKAAHKAAPARTIEEDAAAVAEGVEVLSALGVTSFLDAAVPPRVARAYNHLDQAGGLKARAALAMSEGVLTVYSDESLEELVAGRDAFKSPNVLPDYVKFFLDGIPPTYTALFLDPYLPTTKFGDHFLGDIYYSGDELARLVTAFDASGATVKIHATADGSVRAALDAFAVARAQNGNSGLPHQIAHAGYVHPDDRGRFAQLGVVVDACPTFWFPHVIVTAIEWAIGKERAYQYWPFRDIIDQGGSVALGSDWPVLPSPNPLLGIEAMVTRRDPQDTTSEALWPEQSITLMEALRSATLEGARALNIGDQAGSIESGKSADLIVLDRNLLEIPIKEVSDARVLQTYFRGREVYRADP